MYSYCPTLDEMNPTAEEQFVLDSMSVITDEELLQMTQGSLEEFASFIEIKGRKRKMERMDPETKEVFRERLHEKQRIDEEKRIMKEIEMERQRKDEIARRRKLKREERERKRIEELARLQFLEEENNRLEQRLTDEQARFQFLENENNRLEQRLADEQARLQFLEEENNILKQRLTNEQTRYEEFKNTSEKTEKSLRDEIKRLNDHLAAMDLLLESPSPKEPQVQRPRKFMTEFLDRLFCNPKFPKKAILK